jgi:hypothetical protein
MFVDEIAPTDPALKECYFSDFNLSGPDSPPLAAGLFIASKFVWMQQTAGS